MNKKKAYKLIDLSLWIINPLLITAIIFGPRIETGLFLQWMGKMHPLALHFPIVIGISIAIYFIFFSKHRLQFELEKIFLGTNALFASVVALLGVFLANQGDYEGEIFDLHKWGGFAIAIFSWLLTYILNANEHLKRIVAIIFLGVMVGATHKGAQLTHGVNALSFPEKESSGSNISEFESSASIFEVGIEPIFMEKCISCHGPDREKGKLRLDSKEYILRGGKSGGLLLGHASEEALLLKRVHIPIEDDGHMPPSGKLQLTDMEKAILRNWVRRGSNFEFSMNDLPKEDSLAGLIEDYLLSKKKVEIKTNLPGLDEFNTDYCTVNYLFYGSDKVEVNFFQASFYQHETLKKLLKIKDQIVRLNMQNMPLETEDMDIILQFANLEKVNLNSTGLGIYEIQGLNSIGSLQSLAICGIVFDDNELDQLLSEANFKAINLWADNLNSSKLEKLIARYPEIEFTIGDNLEDKILKINSPVIEQDSLIIKTSLDVSIKHLLNGVDIFYTTDGSEPDSSSMKYASPIKVSENTLLKAKAYKDGWYSSDIVQRTFYKSGIIPDTIYLSKLPHPKYPGKGALTLIDRSLGETNISNGEWLGYQDHDLEFTLGFEKAQALKSIEINSLTALAPHIFPIKSISVEGSSDGKAFEPLNKVEFPLAKEGSPRQAQLSACPLPDNTRFSFYKVRVSNVKKMPDWHAAKGKKAWIFVDEIFLN